MAASKLLISPITSFPTTSGARLGCLKGGGCNGDLSRRVFGTDPG